ncbi:MAG: DNA adenine methylase [Bdellovibrionota bacterium]
MSGAIREPIVKRAEIVRSGIRVQSVMLDKNYFTTPESATSYAESMGFDVDKRDEIGDYYTFEQLSKERFREPLQEFNFGKGVVGIVGTFDSIESDTFQSANEFVSTLARIQDLPNLDDGLVPDKMLRKIERLRDEHKGVVDAIKTTNEKMLGFLEGFGVLLSPLEKSKIREASEDIEKRHPKPFSSPGGKDVWIPTLSRYIPEHKTYVEPYAGSASLFFAKEPAQNSILAELNGDMVGFFKFLQGASEADLEWLRNQEWERSESRFNALLKRTPSSQREKVYKFKYLNLHSHRGHGATFDKSTKGISTGRTFLANLEKFRDRLKSAKILNQDALAVMKRFDGPDVFFYVDPPWKPVGRGSEWREFDEDEFVKVMKGLKGKVLISYQGDLDLGKRFSRRSYTKNQFGNMAGNESRQTLYYNFSRVRKGEPETFDVDVALALAAIGSIEIPKSSGYSKTLGEVLKKGFLSGHPEGGPHAHRIDRINKSTQDDDGHPHLFILPDGNLLMTFEDGNHHHPLSDSDVETAARASSIHKHKATLASDLKLSNGTVLKSGTVLETDEGGDHEHGTMLESTHFDGAHPYADLARWNYSKKPNAGNFSVDSLYLKAPAKERKSSYGTATHATLAKSTKLSLQIDLMFGVQLVDRFLLRPCMMASSSRYKKNGDDLKFRDKDGAEVDAFGAETDRRIQDGRSKFYYRRGGSSKTSTAKVIPPIV